MANPNVPKLPRKRKKACIKADGRKKYFDTVNLAKVTGELPCKFWKTYRNLPTFIGDTPIILPTAISYW